MGNINISDLRPAGADLFLDSESYLNDLTEGEMLVFGGLNSRDVVVHSHVASACCFRRALQGGEAHLALQT